MPTWDCDNCHMPMKLIEKNPNVACPNCGRRMIEISE
jgi:DNA-directed RNA polymerase subunit RPC12/RpoP